MFRELGRLELPDREIRQFLALDLTCAKVSRAGFSVISGDEGPVAAAFRDSILERPETPFSASLLTTESGFTLGARWPEPFLPALAAALRASLAASAGLSPGSSEDG